MKYPPCNFFHFCVLCIDKFQNFGIIIFAVRSKMNMQWYRRGHNEHDWKSCCRQKRHEGSNPSHCATKRHAFACLFFISRLN